MGYYRMDANIAPDNKSELMKATKHTFVEWLKIVGRRKEKPKKEKKKCDFCHSKNLRVGIIGELFCMDCNSYTLLNSDYDKYFNVNK